MGGAVNSESFEEKVMVIPTRVNGEWFGGVAGRGRSGDGES